MSFMLIIEKWHNSISKTFRLPIDLVNEMEKIADNNKISLNNLVIQCLEYAVDILSQMIKRIWALILLKIKNDKNN